MNVLLSIAVLGLLIFFHESGHFLAAVLQKIKVSGFSIGFGPALLKKEINGITYSLRSLPLGGFVSFPDEDTDSLVQPNDPDLLKNRPIHQRAIVISAGVIAIFAIFLAGSTPMLLIPRFCIGSRKIPSLLPISTTVELLESFKSFFIFFAKFIK